jgi:hypothetical protein
MSTLHHPMPRHRKVYRSMLHYSRTLHTYFSMLATVLFIFFASTGFMLNHPVWFGLDNSHTTDSTITIPDPVITAKDKLALVEFLRAHGATGAVDKFDWPGDGEPFHVSFKSPKAQCDADITLPGGETHLSIETHGLSGLITRLHTAKDAGPIWRLFLDATAILLLLVCITGLILWQSLPKRRMVGSIAMAMSVMAVVLAYWLCVP